MRLIFSRLKISASPFFARSTSFKWNSSAVEVSSNAALTVQSQSPRFHAVMFSCFHTLLFASPAVITTLSLDCSSTVVPIALVFDYYPDSAELAAAIDEVVTFDLYFDDPHGTREHRRHLTYYYAEQIRAELEGA